MRTFLAVATTERLSNASSHSLPRKSSDQSDAAGTMASLLDELNAVLASSEPSATVQPPATCKNLSDKIKLLEAAPLAAVVLDVSGKAKESNLLFDQLMGPVWKFANFEFADAAADDESKAKLHSAIAAVRLGGQRQRLRNVLMLTVAAGLPIKSHFDWFIGPGEEGEVVVPVAEPSTGRCPAVLCSLASSTD